MIRTITIVATMDDAQHPDGITPTDADLDGAIRASLEEVYPTDDNWPFQPTDVRIYVGEPDGLALMLDAADVGLEGLVEDDALVEPPNELDVAHAYDLLDAMRGKA